MARIQELEYTLKIFADRTRLRILRLLQASGELCVCEILQALDMNQATVSKALSVLKSAGFVSARRDGLWMRYSLGGESRSRYFADVSAMLPKWLGNDASAKKDAERLKKAARPGRKTPCIVKGGS